MTYPLKFRQHVLKVQEQEGLSFEQTAQRFRIGKTSLVRWHQKLEPAKKRNRAPSKILMEALAEDVKRYPDAYQYERASRLGVSKNCVHYALKRLGITFKKRVSSIQKLIVKLKAAFQAKLKQYQQSGKPLVYIDESGFAQDMPRLYGYAQKGERCFGKRNWQAKGRINVIGALHNQALLTVCLYEGNINGDIFQQLGG